VTVGAEKRPFNRLIKIVDRFAAAKIFPENTFVQTGHSTYCPKHCSSRPFLNYDEMEDRVAEADVVISHAGMGTVILCLRHRKIPILFPRRFRFKEHVDDHQVIFSRTAAQKGLALTAFSQEELQKTYLHHKSLSQSLGPIRALNKNNELGMYLKEVLNNFSTQKGFYHGY